MTKAAAIEEYLHYGLSLVPIPPGSKGPRHPGWNQKGSALKSAAELLPDYGIGLAHAYSGTMAFDVDSIEKTVAYGIDVQSLANAPDSVIVWSGREGRCKLLYKMPFGLLMPTKRVTIDNGTAFEFRCATLEGLTVQDVLPPSIHPDTNNPYQWAGNGHWTSIPPLPHNLYTVWYNLLNKENISVKVDGVDASWEEIQGALGYINPDCSREEWIQVGMALHWAGTQTFQKDQALALWNGWSMQSRVKYPGDRVIVQQWNSFHADKNSTITLGTLFHLARQNGWVRPVPDASELFKAVSMTSPNDLFNGVNPRPPDIDMSLWPPVLAKRAQEVSDGIGCDPIIPLFAGLAAVCGVVDAQSRLELMPGFKVPPVLWLMTLGDPSDKKTPGSAPMIDPLVAITAADYPRYKKELLDWELREAAYSSAKSALMDFAKRPEFLLPGGMDDAPGVPELPPAPVPLQILVSDVTSQKLVRLAADRPRGLLCYLDEMNSWTRKMIDRGSGEDRSSWVISYESRRYVMDRVASSPVVAENMAVSIYGNIQPRLFKDTMTALSQDGMLQRFIPAIIDHTKSRKGHPLPDHLTSSETWENTLRLVYAMPAMTFKLSPEAYTAFRSFQDWYEDMKQTERLLQAGDTYMTAFGKLEGLAGRIALLFHTIENPFSNTVSAALMNRVIRLIKEYLVPAYRHMLGEIDGAEPFDRWLSEWVIQHASRPSITLSEIKKGARAQLAHISSTFAASNIVMMAMYNLEQANWVARADDGSKEHQHIAEWLINPALKEMFKEHRERVIAAKQHIRDHMWESNDRQSPRPMLPGSNEIGL